RSLTRIETQCIPLLRRPAPDATPQFFRRIVQARAEGFRSTPAVSWLLRAPKLRPGGRSFPHVLDAFAKLSRSPASTSTITVEIQPSSRPEYDRPIQTLTE